MTLSNSFSNALIHRCSVKPQDRVAILLPQCPETLISHISVQKVGGIALPLFILFGPDALEYRLKDSGSKVLLVGDLETYEKVEGILDKLPDLETIIYCGSTIPMSSSLSPHGKIRENVKVLSFWDDLIPNGSTDFTAVPTTSETPAVIIYTSGTTGNPKGTLHAQRILPGHMPGVEFPHNFFPQPGDCFWTPADYAWIGGLFDVLLSSQLHGCPVVAYRDKKFNPEKALRLMAKYHVRNVFFPPTALKLMRSLPYQSNQSLWKSVNLRSIGSGGEALGSEILQWGREVFGVEINEFYGQTEANLLISNCSKVFDIRAGSMGKKVPGRIAVDIVNEEGTILGIGETGQIGCDRRDPVAFLRYWNKPEKTQEKYSKDGRWILTGDIGKKDQDGYFYYVGRDDDIIKTSGYRVGPCEIENCIAKHPSVLMSAVVGVPDQTRGQLVKAFVVLKEEYRNPTNNGLDLERRKILGLEIQEFVKSRLAAYEYPRLIEFVDELPMTNTGKIIRKDLRDKKP